jgi:hypothetical protein
MRKVLLGVLLASLFVVPCWGGVESVESPDAVKGVETEAGRAVANTALADQLAELGRAQKSPLLLASAAQILSGAGTPTDLKREKTEEDVPPDQRSPQASEKNPVGTDASVESLYAEAIALAKENGDAEMAGVIEGQSRVGAAKGAFGGVIRHYDRVRAYCNDIYTIRFNGGERAWVRVRGDGDPTALYIFDSSGRLVASDTDWHTQSTVSWIPRQSGNYKVVVKNRVGVYVNYVLLTN